MGVVERREVLGGRKGLFETWRWQSDLSLGGFEQCEISVVVLTNRAGRHAVVNVHVRACVPPFEFRAWPFFRSCLPAFAWPC